MECLFTFKNKKSQHAVRSNPNILAVQKLRCSKLLKVNIDSLKIFLQECPIVRHTCYKLKINSASPESFLMSFVR